MKLAVRYIPKLVCSLLMLAVTVRGEVVSLPADPLRLELDEQGAIRTLDVGPRTFASDSSW